MSDVLVLSARLRKAIEARDTAAVQRLISAYQSIYKRLVSDIEALTLTIGDLEAPTSAQVRKLSQYRRLMEDVTVELQKFQGYLEIEISQSARLAIESGIQDAFQLVAESTAGRVASSFHTLNPDTIENLLGFLNKNGPLYKSISDFSNGVADRISEAILSGVSAGNNPKIIAREITKSFGMGLTDAMRTTRTVQIYSYREANRASYIANSDIVQGWIWNSALQPGRTCMSCVAMHGTEHTLDETLNDHYCGLCSMIPLVIGSKNPIADNGAAWFEKQDEATQRRMLGDKKFDYWKNGKIGIDQLSTVKPDDIYGEMRTETSLKELGL